MRAAQAGMNGNRTKENFPDSQISPLKLENALPTLRMKDSRSSSDTGILHELKAIRSELSESMHKLKVFSATTAAGIPQADGESFSRLCVEISELVARMNISESKAGAIFETQMEKIASQFEIRTTVLRGFESNLVIDDSDDSLFITRKANLISVIHELSNKSGFACNSTKDDNVSSCESTNALLVEASWQKQLAQQQIQISSLQHQLEEQIAHIRMAAEKELQKRTLVISQQAQAETTAAQACMIQALKEVEKTFEIIEQPVSLTSSELSCSDSALLISEVMSECNRIIQERLSAASVNSNPEFQVLDDLDAQVRKYVTAESEVGKLFAVSIEHARTAYLKAVNQCNQQQRHQWIKQVKSLREEFTNMTDLVESTLPEKAVKAVRQIVFENNRRLCAAIDWSEPRTTPSKLTKSSTKMATKPISKFEAVAPVSPSKIVGTGRPGSAYSAGRGKDNSYAKSFAKHMDDSRQGHVAKGLFN